MKLRLNMRYTFSRENCYGNLLLCAGNISVRPQIIVQNILSYKYGNDILSSVSVNKSGDLFCFITDISGKTET